MNSTSNPLISIIVPVYNVEKYIHRCIESILKQTYKNIELILVDDGSLDNSGSICDNYENKDKRIIIIHQKNQGVTSARFSGFKVSTGEYITFVDGDDFLPDNSIESLVQAIEDKIDIVIGNFNITCFPSKYISNYDYRRDCIIGNLIPSLCGHLYRKNIFNKDIFDLKREINIGEDMIMNMRLSFRTEKMVKFIPQVVYYYCNNPNSAMNNRNISLDYEYLFQRYLKAAIPSDMFSYYKKYYVIPRKRALLEYIKLNPESKNWIDHPFYKEVVQDINFEQLRFFERKIIFSKFDIVRKFYVYTYKLLRRLVVHK